MSNLLSVLIFLPLVAALLVLVLPGSQAKRFKYLALGASLLQLVGATYAYLAFQRGAGAPSGVNRYAGFQFVERFDWFELNLGSLGRISANYFLGVDGLSISMVLLTAIIMTLGVLASWRTTKNPKGYFALYLLLSGSIMGSFVALDFLLFYLFFEFMLLPMYFLIGIWGGPRREYAAIKFFLYTLAGSIFILAVMIGLSISVYSPLETGQQAGLISPGQTVGLAQVQQVQYLVNYGRVEAQDIVHTFDMVAMTNPQNYLPGSLMAPGGGTTMWGLSARLLAFLLLFIGFAIKLPVVPLHTWLPDAHVEASTAISVVLAGILLKVGGYGLMRIAYPILPEGAGYFAWWVGLLGVISIIYGALNALGQQDLKKLIAYSSVSHMGFVLLGLASLTAEGVSGAIYQMFSHGLIAAMLFLISGVVYSRTQNRLIDNYGGLHHLMPKYTAFVLVAFFASLGLPGFSGFIAELFVLIGAFRAQEANNLLPQWMALVALVGLLLGAAYYLWTLQRMFFGPLRLRQESWRQQLTDLTPREYLMFVPLTLLILLFGLWPAALFDWLNATTQHFVTFVERAARASILP